MEKIGRNESCPCGSGKKYKRCCLSQPNGKKQSSILKPGFIPVYTDLDTLSTSVMDLIKRKKFNKAEKVCKKLLTQYPDQIDGFMRFAQIYEARGDNQKAADFYRKAADFAKSMPGFDQQSVTYYLSQAQLMMSKSQTDG